jgi:tripartite-type tricarboxylate transporter receptor subunit TctC
MSILRRQFIYLAAGTGLASVFPRAAWTQSYPARSVHVIVPLSAGSAADILARRLAQKMSESWGRPVIVENRPGAGTTLGADFVAKAEPDGHTLLINSAAFAASAAVRAKLPYDPLKDFAPISQVATAPVVIVAAPSLGAKSVKDLIDIVKARSGQINFGSAGVGSSTHFAGEQFKLAAGINVVHVPYKGPPEALLDTATGRVEYSFSPLLPALPFIKDGKLLALGVTTAWRSQALPDVPTVAEGGVPGFDYQDWWGVFAPAATPRDVVDKIAKEMARILVLPDVAEQLLGQGAQASPSEPAEFTHFVQRSVGIARDVAARAGIRTE